MLNAASPTPLYQQLAERLTTAIRADRYRVGARIPSEHELAARYGVGRPTVRQATELLVRRGILSRRRGAGTFVVGRPRELDAFSIAGTLASFRDQGIEVETRLLSPVKTRSLEGDDPALTGNPFVGRDAHFIRRLSRTSEGAALLEETYLDTELFDDLPELDLHGRSLAALVREHYRMEPTGGRQQLSVTAVAGQRAHALELPSGASVLLIRRELNFPQGHAAIYAELYCRTDRVALSQSLSSGRGGD